MIFTFIQKCNSKTLNRSYLPLFWIFYANLNNEKRNRYFDQNTPLRSSKNPRRTTTTSKSEIVLRGLLFSHFFDCVLKIYYGFISVNSSFVFLQCCYLQCKTCTAKNIVLCCCNVYEVISLIFGHWFLKNKVTFYHHLTWTNINKLRTFHPQKLTNFKNIQPPRNLMVLNESNASIIFACS